MRSDFAKAHPVAKPMPTDTARLNRDVALLEGANAGRKQAPAPTAAQVDADFRSLSPDARAAVTIMATYALKPKPSGWPK